MSVSDVEMQKGTSKSPESYGYKECSQGKKILTEFVRGKKCVVLNEVLFM